METLEQAALAHAEKATPNNIILERCERTIANASFQAGAEWQKEQYKQLIHLVKNALFDIGFENEELAGEIRTELERLKD